MTSEQDARAGGGFGPERLAELVDALPVGIFILDAGGNAIYANGAAQKLLGRGIVSGDAAGNLGERFAAFVAGTGEHYPTARMPIVRALGGERTTIDDMEVERHGERIALEVTATPIVDDHGRVVFAVAVFQDITARRHAQDALALLNGQLEVEVARRTADLAGTVRALEHEIRTRKLYEDELLRAKTDAETASKAKSLFLMNVSHELRTPLNHIIGFNELLSERLDDAKTRRMAETAGASGRDLLEKVNDLIELARAEAEPSGAAVRELDLDAILIDAAARHGVRCETTAPLGTGRCDHDAVRLILLDVFAKAKGNTVTAKALRLSSGNGCLIIRIMSDDLTSRVRGMADAFGERPDDDDGRYRQRPVDFRLAVARTQARAMGGDIVVVDDDGRPAVDVLLPFAAS